MPASMRDVARVAGVSQRTVSNVVNNYVHVRAETRERVQNAIRLLNYRPNVSAQKLRQGRTGIIALAVPEIAAPYFAELADHLQRCAAANGTTLLIDQTGGTRERELLVLEGYRSNVIDALILSPLSITAGDLAPRPIDVPVILLGESVEPCGYRHVSIDNIAAARAATQHLIAAGRSRIAALGAHFSVGITGPAERRLQGYIETISAAGMALDPQLTLRVDHWNRADGYQVTRELISSGAVVDAIFCFNDALALGTLKALADHGVRVPDDIAVVGWDDVEEASYSHPTLTTVAPDKRQIATRAIAELLAELQGTAAASHEIVCDFELKVRRSAP